MLVLSDVLNEWRAVLLTLPEGCISEHPQTSRVISLVECVWRPSPVPREAPVL